MAREYIEREDLLNQGRIKLNKSIDKAYDADETSKQSLEDANRLGNEAKQISTDKGNESISIANKKGNESIAIAKENEKVAGEANLIAKDTNDRMNQIIGGTTDSGEIIDARKPLGEEASATLGERLNSQIGRTGLFREFEKPLVEKMMNAFFEREVNIKDFGAKCDGITPDDDAIYRALEVIKENGGGCLFFPSGVTIVDFVIKVENLTLKIKGNGINSTTIKARDQSRLFHNPTRDLTSNLNTGLDKLYRDYHAIFFFDNCNVTLENFTLDGNPEENWEIKNGEKYHFYAETIHSHLGIKGYKYFHGVSTRSTTAKNILTMKYCRFDNFSWNDLTMNTNGKQIDSEVEISFCTFNGSAQDGLSIHKSKKNIQVHDNIFINCNTHATHR